MNKNFVICFLAFLSGILLGNFFIFNNFYLFLTLLLLLILSTVFWTRKQIHTIFLLAVFLLLGMWRIGISQPMIDEKHIAFYAGSPEQASGLFRRSNLIRFVGQVIDEPDIRSSQRKLTVGKIFIKSSNNILAQQQSLGPAGWSFVQGKILVNAPNYPEINYGDELEIKCALERPGQIEDFDYGRYLSVKGIYAVCYRPERVRIVEQGDALFLRELNSWQKMRRGLIGFKFKAKEILNRALAYPENEVMGALLLGLRKGIPDEVLENFSAAGLSHIVAISGMHITILSGILLAFFLALGLWRKQAFAASQLVILLFLMLIGFRASSIRAGAMGFLLAGGYALGRLNQSLRALILAAFSLLMANPRLLLGDIGFQLSFLAVLGIMFGHDGIANRLDKWHVPNWFGLRSIIAMTLAAQIFVLPLVVYYFGTLSFIAPLANILVLPLLPFIMIAGLLVIALGLIYLPAAKILGLLAGLLVGWVNKVAEFIVQLPGSHLMVEKVDLLVILTVYGGLAWLVWLKFNYKGKKGY